QCHTLSLHDALPSFDITPAGLNKVFFSDSGSVAVEIALKMALQYWIAQGQHQRTQFLALRSGYHGDTFAAMSVCDPIGGMHGIDRKSTRLNSSHVKISYAV